MSVCYPSLMLSENELNSPEFHATRRLNSLWRTYLEKCKQDFYDDLQNANSVPEIQQLMIDKDLFDSPSERKKVRDKQVIITQFEKEFDEALKEYTELIASTRRLSFIRGKSPQALFHKKFKNCMREFLEISQFKDWALNKKKSEWNAIEQLINKDRKPLE